MALQSPLAPCRPEKGKNGKRSGTSGTPWRHWTVDGRLAVQGTSSLRCYQSIPYPRTQRSSAPGRLTGTGQGSICWAASPRKPQLFVTQATSPAQLSHCQSLQQQTPRPDHRPSPSVRRVKATRSSHSITAIVITISSLSIPSWSSIHHPPLSSASPIPAHLQSQR